MQPFEVESSSLLDKNHEPSQPAAAAVATGGEREGAGAGNGVHEAFESMSLKEGKMTNDSLREESEAHASKEAEHEQFEEAHGPHGAKLSFLPLVALIFFEVSGGPYGVEDAVKNGGPLLAILGFLVFPLIWSIPEALITAELGTAFPENGGYVVWITAAFGSFWGFQEGWWKWLSGVIDNSLYPILFLDYLKNIMPMFGGGAPRVIALILITLLLTYLNYRGLTIVGATAIGLAAFGLLPFVVLAVLAIPRIRPTRWLQVNLQQTNWRGYFNTLFWNLNYWDSVSTLAGEVDNPKKTFPKALGAAVLLVVLAYIIPLLSGTGALPFDPEGWDDGYFAVVGQVIGGSWLAWWMAVAAALSNMGQFEAEMSSDSFQLLGMAERGMLPELFAYRSKYGTPVLGILCSASGVFLLSWMSFTEIVEFLNYLYCLGMILEFAAFISLRVTHPELERPYMVPLGTVGVALMCLPPTVLLLIVMYLASWKTVIVSSIVGLVGVLAYPLLLYMKKWGVVAFCEDPSLPHTPLLEDLYDTSSDQIEEDGIEEGKAPDASREESKDEAMNLDSEGASMSTPLIASDRGS